MSHGWLLLTLRSCQITGEAKNVLNSIVKAIRPKAAENAGTFWSGLCQKFSVQGLHTLPRITIFEDRINGIRNLIELPLSPSFSPSFSPASLPQIVLSVIFVCPNLSFKMILCQSRRRRWQPMSKWCLVLVTGNPNESPRISQSRRRRSTIIRVGQGVGGYRKPSEWILSIIRLVTLIGCLLPLNQVSNQPIPLMNGTNHTCGQDIHPLPAETTVTVIVDLRSSTNGYLHV